jgi:pentatricopeptide repeat protein
VLAETWSPIYASGYQLESVIRYLYYYYLLENHLSSASMGPFYETLVDLASRVKDPSGLAILPRYFLLRKCPGHLQGQLQALLEKHTPKLHWEHHLHSACAFAERGDAERAIASVGHAIAADADTSSVEFFNAISSVLAPANPYSYARAAAYLIPMLLRELAKPKIVHPLIYARMAEKGLDLGDPATLLAIFRFHKRRGVRIYPRTRTLLLRGMEKCEDEEVLRLITAEAKMHCLRSRSAVIGTHAIYCWMLFHSRRGSTALYNDLLPHYLHVFDPRALQELGLPTVVARQPTTSRKRMEPNGSVLSMLLHAYFTDNSNDANHVRSTYNRFQKAVENRSRSILLALRETPSVYTVFLLAISRLEGTKHLQECMTVMADLSTELPPDTLPLDLETGMPMKVAGPNLRTWNVLLRAFGHHRQFAAAEKVLAEIRQRWGPEGAQVGAHTLMSAYAGVQNVQGAMDIFRQLMKENLQVPEHTLKALGRLNNRDDLERIWAEEETWDDGEG